MVTFDGWDFTNVRRTAKSLDDEVVSMIYYNITSSNEHRGGKFIRHFTLIHTSSGMNVTKNISGNAL